MAEHKITSLQLIDILEHEWHNYNYSPISTIPYLLDMVYPADGVDNIKQTINGSHKAFHSSYGHNFRNDSLTRLASFLGLPNRQLHIKGRQSLGALLENFTGGISKSSEKKIAIMIPLNILLTPLRFLLNITKIITEFIPALLAVIVVLTIIKLFKSLEFPIENALGRLGIDRYLNKNILGSIGFLLLSPLIIVPGVMYLGGCCLTSSYESMKAAWHFGAEVIGKDLGNRIFGFVFVAIIIVITIVTNIFALPWAAKFLTTTFIPLLAPYLPHVIINGLDKIGTVIKPLLTTIGNVLAPIIKYSQLILPEFVGAGLFGAIVRTLISPIINYGVDKINTWLNYNPEFEEKSEIDILNQQIKMLCDLGAIQENQPVAGAVELPKIINDYSPNSPPVPLNFASNNQSQLYVESDNPSQPLLSSVLNNSVQAADESREERNPAAERSISDYSLKPPSAASSSLFPPEYSLKPVASAAQSQTRANVVERISPTTIPSPRGH